MHLKRYSGQYDQAVLDHEQIFGGPDTLPLIEAVALAKRCPEIADPKKLAYQLREVLKFGASGLMSVPVAESFIKDLIKNLESMG